jgi:PAS domain S-box-containing protein
MEEKTSILIVDDDKLICKSLTTVFAKQGYETVAATTGREAIEKARGRFFNLALLDIKLPDMEGTELLPSLKDMHPDMVVIIITGYGSLESAVQALHQGASAYVTKPLKMDELLATAREGLEKQRLAAEKGAAEEALRESEQRYRMLVETMNDGLGLIDTTGVFTYLNDKHCEMLGYSRDEMIGHSITDFLAETGHQRFSEKWTKRSKGKAKHYELVWNKKDGQQITTIISPQPIFDARNNFQGAFAVVTDITERKRAEEELQREKQAVQRLAEERDLVARVGRIISSTLEIEKVYELFAEEVGKVIPFDRIAINIIDLERGTHTPTYVAGNDAGRRAGDVVPLAGTFTQEVMRTRSSQLIQEDDIGKVKARFPGLSPLFQVGVRSFMAVPLISKDQVIGVLNFGSLKSDAYTDADVKLAESIGSQIAGAIANAQLYTEHKRAEEALARQAQELGRSNAELEQFAYVASHDLQEPLRKIQAFGDRLKAHCNDALDERGNDYLKRMQNAADRLQRLINDLLTFSRVTIRAQPFVPVNLSAVARDVVSDLEVRIERTDGRVEVNGLPTVDADPSQMHQLLQNLIDNGLKFHRPEQPPVVKVHGKLRGNRSQIMVEDNGVGFDEKYLDRIFTIFQRLHGRLEYEGTGVGLAVCRKIAERHSGSITAQSAPGKGTTFIVTLPVKQPRKEEMCNG